MPDESRYFWDKNLSMADWKLAQARHDPSADAPCEAYLMAAQERIAELEEQLKSTNKWTRITNDPATWPPKTMEAINLAWKVDSQWKAGFDLSASTRKGLETGTFPIEGTDWWQHITMPEDDDDK